MDLEEKRLYIKLAYGYYQNKEYKKAIDLYERLKSGEPDDFNVLNMLGDTYLKSGKKEEALEAYVDTLSALERKGQNERIIKLCKKTLKTFPDESRIKNRLKTSLRHMLRDAEKKAMHKQFEDAREIYEAILYFNSEEYPVETKLRELNEEEAVYLERTRKMKARESEKKEDPQHGLIEKFDKMASNYMDNGDYDGAVETYITALKLAPNNQELRSKLHRVYMTIAQASEGDRVWEKIDTAPRDKVAEAKQKAMEERHAKIMEEEEERAKKLLSEEEKFQQEYEKKEMEIIQKAAEELKIKLDEAQKKEKLKEEEIQRIMREQEQKKRALLEKVKKEAVEKWKKQKEQMQKKTLEEEAGQQAAQQQASPPGQEEPDLIQAQNPKGSLIDQLKKTYELPKIGAEDGKLVPELSQKQVFVDEKKMKPVEKKEEPKKMIDDTGEAQREPVNDDLIVNEDTLDSLFTTAFIYINQDLVKEALRIYNKITEKYPDHPEAKQLIEEITKRGKG